MSKFNLYVPEEFTVEYSSGIVSAILPDGSSINMAKATPANMRVDEYLNNRLEELKTFVEKDSIQVVQFPNDRGEMSNFKDDTLGNSKSAVSQEYTFIYNGVKYHVYQVCAITWLNGFVFTYTATEENYLNNLDTIKKIAEKVEF